VFQPSMALASPCNGFTLWHLVTGPEVSTLNNSCELLQQIVPLLQNKLYAISTLSGLGGPLLPDCYSTYGTECTVSTLISLCEPMQQVSLCCRAMSARCFNPQRSLRTTATIAPFQQIYLQLISTLSRSFRPPQFFWADPILLIFTVSTLSGPLQRPKSQSGNGCPQPPERTTATVYRCYTFLVVRVSTLTSSEGLLQHPS
jgi:hypothetical protein